MNTKQIRNTFEYKNDDLYWRVAGYRSKPGDRAGSTDSNGYRRITVSGKNYYIHRLIYQWHFGVAPTYVDHIDRNPLNNCIENLRPCTPAQNAQNRKVSMRNTSGVKGLYWNKDKKKWMARIMVQGRRSFLGYFDSATEAKKVLLNNRSKLHGAFARST
jgi:hypothetical protein